MAARKILTLDEASRIELERIVKRGRNWRERERAQTLLLLGAGVFAEDVARQMKLNIRTVRTTRAQWLQGGLASLPDRPRRGAPKKLKPEHVQRIVGWALAEPLTAASLLAAPPGVWWLARASEYPVRHAQVRGAGVQAHPALAQKNRDEASFRQADVEIKALRQRAASGEIELAYLDEAGFSAVHPNRGAWTPMGQCHLIEAKRGKRLNVLAALLSSGRLVNAKYWQTTTADVFVGFLAWLKSQVDKPLTIVLDNASIHTAKSTRRFVRWLGKQGVTLYFLPAYSPELNRIERLWHKIKHTWMAAKCRTAPVLEADVGHILDHFGSTYKFEF